MASFDLGIVLIFTSLLKLTLLLSEAVDVSDVWDLIESDLWISDSRLGKRRLIVGLMLGSEPRLECQTNPDSRRGNAHLEPTTQKEVLFDMFNIQKRRFLYKSNQENLL